MEFYKENCLVSDTYIIMCTVFCMCGKGLDFFLVKLLDKTTNCNINGILIIIQIFVFHHSILIVLYVTESCYYLTETLNAMLLHTLSYFNFKSMKSIHISISLTFFLVKHSLQRGTKSHLKKHSPT